MALELASLLTDEGIDPLTTIVFRHRPSEPALRAAFGWLAEEEPALFNDYQRTHGPRAEASLARAKHVASFIGHAPGQAVFVGLYQQRGGRLVDMIDSIAEPGFEALIAMGVDAAIMRHSGMLFDLRPLATLAGWKGRLVVDWPKPDRSWFRWLDPRRNRFPVRAIHEDSLLVRAMPAWTELTLDWTQLRVLPSAWRDRMSQWRGIYLIFDEAAGKSYVGSAYGADNILGRWLTYAASGHGGNRLLRDRDPRNFNFSVLELLAPSLPSEAVLAIEASWKARLHTRAPFGLNAN